MRVATSVGSLALLSLVFAGCGSGDQPDFPDLHPVKGAVKRGGRPVKGGVVTFDSAPPNAAFLINSEVGNDGTFELTTVRTTDKTGERKSGAPAGTYRVTYQPFLGDQTAGGEVEPTVLRGTVTIKEGNNDLALDVPSR